YEAQQVLAARARVPLEEGEVEADEHLDLHALAGFAAAGAVTRERFDEELLGGAAGFSAQASVGKAVVVNRVASMARHHRAVAGMRREVNVAVEMSKEGT